MDPGQVVHTTVSMSPSSIHRQREQENNAEGAVLFRVTASDQDPCLSGDAPRWATLSLRHGVRYVASQFVPRHRQRPGHGGQWASPVLHQPRGARVISQADEKVRK